jgi:uncharacterized lipoprotein YddW (UPF0748 family)
MMWAKECLERWSFLFLVFLVGCGGGVSSVSPGSNQTDAPAFGEPGLFRGLWWADPDIELKDDRITRKGMSTLRMLFMIIMMH